MQTRSLIAPLVLLALAGPACAADVAAGKAYFTEVCSQCHTADPNEGGGETGPVLFGLFGRPAAVVDDMFPYSKALKDSGLVWDAATLDRFLTNPAAVVPGTAMATPIPDKKDRDNVIAYFQSLIAGKK